MFSIQFVIDCSTVPYAYRVTPDKIDEKAPHFAQGLDLVRLGLKTTKERTVDILGTLGLIIIIIHAVSQFLEYLIFLL